MIRGVISNWGVRFKDAESTGHRAESAEAEGKAKDPFDAATTSSIERVQIWERSFAAAQDDINNH